MTDLAAGNVWQTDIVQLKLANATMRSANRALACDDVATLSALAVFACSHPRVKAERGLSIIRHRAEQTNDQLPT